MAPKRDYKWLGIASILCALLAWPSVNLGHPWLPMPPDLVGLSQPTTEQGMRIFVHTRLNETIALMFFGAIAMVAGAPVFGKRLKPIALLGSLIIALGIGAAAGYLMALNGFYCEDWLPISWDVLVRSTVRSMGMLLPLGLVAAVLTVICTGNWNRTGTLLVAGTIGTMLAALAYSLITTILLANENADAVLPQGTYSRLLLFVIAPLAIWSTIEHQYHAAGRTEEPNSNAELNVA